MNGELLTIIENIENELLALNNIGQRLHYVVLKDGKEHKLIPIDIEPLRFLPSPLPEIYNIGAINRKVRVSYRKFFTNDMNLFDLFDNLTRLRKFEEDDD